MAESRFWRCEGCDCVLMDFNRPVGQEQVREYRCDSEDDNRYCLDCCKKAEDSTAPTGPHKEGKDG